MGVIVNKDNTKNDELSRRIDADLRDKMRSGLDFSEKEDPDFTEGSEYVRNLKTTSRFGWVWIVLVALAIVSLILMKTL